MSAIQTRRVSRRLRTWKSMMLWNAQQPISRCPFGQNLLSTHEWQRDAQVPRRGVVATVSELQQARMRSLSGPTSSELFTSFLTREARVDSQPFHILLLHRLRLHLPLSARRCRCDRLLDAFGHQQFSCATAGVLGRRGFALESATVRACREAGGRVMANVVARELDLSPIHNRLDGC